MSVDDRMSDKYSSYKETALDNGCYMHEFYYTNNKYWYNRNDSIHRLDGPAIEYANGDKYWYINGKGYSEEEFNQVKEVLWMV